MKPLLPKEPELRIGNVLFMDIVGYSKLKSDKQAEAIKTLNQIVKACLPEEKKLASPTGDGMALAFLENPESPLLTARKIASKVKEAQISLRMGMHTGPVYLVEDINKKRNLAGDGINLAQRVMDCGDEGHILASRVVAEALSGVKEEYERLFYYLGKFEVKHKVVIEIYNVYGEGFGNPNPPQKTPQTGETSSLPLILTNQPDPEPNFVGRDKTLEAITQWYKDPKVYIGALIGWGGVGKSALVRRWFDTLKENDIHPDGIFWWGFYHHADFERFLDALLEYVAQDTLDVTEIKTIWAKVDKIKKFIHKREYLIILDGLEEMQEGMSKGKFGYLTHPAFSELLKYIADTMDRGLCLITTRYPMKDLSNWAGCSYERLEIVDLELEDAKGLLKKRKIQGEEEDFEKVIKRYKGHALALTSLAGYLNKYYEGEIDKAPDVPFIFKEAERWKDVNKLFRRYTEKMSEAELAFLKIFSLFRTEVTERDFAGLFRKHIEGTKLNESLIGMDERDFIDLVLELVEWRLISCSKERKTYTTHPLIKSYFESIFEETDKRLCHKRIYQYFGEEAPDRHETLNQMQPLFEQVYHGCKAGLYDEVYWDVYWEKIHQKEKHFLVYQLGAWETSLSLAKTFFPEGDLSQLPLVSKKTWKSWLLGTAGLALLNTGRPKEAEELFLTDIQMDIDEKDWENASVTFQNLSDLQLRLGKIKSALKSAKTAVDLAEKASSNVYIRDSKADVAHIFHLLGKTKESSNWFKQADELGRKIGGNRLFSIWGIFCADFFLSINELDEAFEFSKQNLKICQRNNWIWVISMCYRSLAAIERIKGNYEEVEVHIQEALKLARKVGMPSLEIEALLEFGRLHLDMDRQKEAIRDAQGVLVLCSRTGFKLYEPDAEVVLAKAYLAKGDKERAKEFANYAYKKAKSMYYHMPKVEATDLLKEISQKDT